MSELSVRLITVFVYCIIVFALNDSYVDELKELNNAVCEEMRCPSSDHVKFIKVWGRLLKFLKDVYMLMNSGDSKGYKIAKYLIDRASVSCFKLPMSEQELKEIYNLSNENTKFLYSLMSTTIVSYSLVEMKYNMKIYAKYEEFLRYVGNNCSDIQTETIRIEEHVANTKPNADEQWGWERNDCIPDFTVQ